MKSLPDPIPLQSIHTQEIQIKPLSQRLRLQIPNQQNQTQMKPPKQKQEKKVNYANWLYPKPEVLEYILKEEEKADDLT